MANSSITADIWTNVTSNQTNRNVTISDIWSSELSSIEKTIVSVSTILAVAIIASNLQFVIVLLIEKHRREWPFGTYLLNLCIVDLVTGIIVLPFLISYTLHRTWHHGRGACQLWVITDYLHTGATSLALFSISTNRILAKVKPEKLKGKHGLLIQITLLTLPWLLTFVIGVPMTTAGMKYLDSNSPNRNFCAYFIKKEYRLAIYSTIWLAPACLLLLMSIVMVVFYRSNTMTWYQLDHDRVGVLDIADDLKVTTVATCVVNVTSSVMWLPMTISMFAYILCRFHCFPSFEVLVTMYFLKITSCCVKPYLWCICPAIRAAYKELFSSVVGVLYRGHGVRKAGLEVRYEKE